MARSPGIRRGGRVSMVSRAQEVVLCAVGATFEMIGGEEAEWIDCDI